VRHQSGVVEHDIDAPIGLGGRVDQVGHLLAVSDVGLDGHGFRPAAGEFLRQGLDALDATRPENDCRPSAERCRAAASPSPLLAPVMTTTLR